MAEVLTESFCERCGTRYTFESAQPRVKRLKGVKVLSRGLKNFVLSDDSSLDEAMAAARSDTDREITSQQLDAFHQTFNFCMTCRQYTCANCWNEAAGACLTCEPHLGHEILPAPFPDLDPNAGLVRLDPADVTNGNGNGHDHANGNGVAAGTMGLGAWPASDLATPEAEISSLDVIDDVEPIDAAARLAALTAIDPTEPITESATGLIGEAEPEDLPLETVAGVIDEDAAAPDAIAAAAPVDSPAPAADTDEVAAAAAAQTAALLHRFRPGQNLDAEIEAYEREQAALEAGAVETTPAPDIAEPIAAAAIASTIDDTPEAQDVPASPDVASTADESDADAERLAAAAALAAVAAQRIDIVEQPTWQIVAPDDQALPVTAPPMLPVQPAPNASQPQWPAKEPEWPAHAQATAGLPFLGRPAQPTGGLESLWAESNREVASAPPAPGRPAQGGVQPCVSCGLSLSATARFCRRCGTSQVA